METRHSYHEELELLERQLLQMGRLARRQVDRAVESLQQGNLSLAEEVIQQDDAVDALDAEIEVSALRLIALQQPVARDLRLVGSALKVTTDLERVGDHAVDIAKISRKLARISPPAPQPPVDVGPLAQMAVELVERSLEALVRYDVALAQQIVMDDDRVDAVFKELRDRLLGMQTDPAHQAAVSYMLLVVVSLERIADHATNIAERVNYVETGYLEPLARQLKQGRIGQEGAST